MPLPAEPISASQQRLDLAELPVHPVNIAGLDGGPLLLWYDSTKRDLPWRRTTDPYGIWVSEIMLQQTQVATVVPYWLRWMEGFPTVEALAAASEQDVLSLWQGLGYYRRGRMMLAGARWMAENGVPTTAQDWLKVPGVGRYTSGAVASIALGESVPIVDGNIERVYARLCGDAASGAALATAAWTWASRELFTPRPGDWNQALMELGATICRPVNPECPICPLKENCVARLTFRVDELPTRLPKRSAISLRFFLALPVYEGRFGLRQIPEGQWWHGMWEFPREQDQATLEAILEGAPLEPLGVIRHSVTHHRITLEVSLASATRQLNNLHWYSVEELQSLPMPAAQRRALKLALAKRL